MIKELLDLHEKMLKEERFAWVKPGIRIYWRGMDDSGKGRIKSVPEGPINDNTIVEVQLDRGTVNKVAAMHIRMVGKGPKK